MWHWHDGADWWAMGIGMLIWIIVLAAAIGLAIGLAIWLVNRGSGGRRPDRDSETAEDILRRRFASGEIDAEEYERRLTVLRR
jgi:putative membrane protein